MLKPVKVVPKPRPKAKPKAKAKDKPQVVKDTGLRQVIDRLSRAPYVQKYVTKIAITTEVARLVRELEKSPKAREEMYFKLIESLDFSDEWMNMAARKKIFDLYTLLKEDEWNDIEPTEDKK